jgi:hypothetical protein
MVAAKAAVLEHNHMGDFSLNVIDVLAPMWVTGTLSQAVVGMAAASVCLNMKLGIASWFQAGQRRPADI